MKERPVVHGFRETAAVCAAAVTAGFCILFLSLFLADSPLAFHPGIAIAFAVAELADFLLALLGKRLGLTRWIRVFLLVSLLLGVLALLFLSVVFVLALIA